MVTIRLTFASWLPEAISALKMLARLGYQITDDHIELALRSALIFDDGTEPDADDL
jgi:hypothetical protein